jgi:hypothetical protein
MNITPENTFNEGNGYIVYHFELGKPVRIEARIYQDLDKAIHKLKIMGFDVSQLKHAFFDREKDYWKIEEGHE